MKVIDHSSINNPALNLAVEEYSLRHLGRSGSYLLFYINKPSIIIGRNQNIYEEINHKFVTTQNIPVYRRISGGGTVYHDKGNLNFSIITDYHSKRLNNYTIFNQPVIEALRSLGIQAYMDHRNAIRVGNKKISGNAQFSASGRMFSHGTLLFNADLEKLKKSLRSDISVIQSRAQKSVRSDIINIKPLLTSKMDIEQFKELIIEHFKKDNQYAGFKGYYEFNKDDWKRINQLKRSRYETWDWNVGKSPRFTIQQKVTLPDGLISIDLEVNKGFISWISLDSDFINGPLLYSMEKLMLNSRFYPEDLRSSLRELPSIHHKNIILEKFITALFNGNQN